MEERARWEGRRRAARDAKDWGEIESTAVLKGVLGSAERIWARTSRTTASDWAATRTASEVVMQPLGGGVSDDAH